MGHIIIMKCPKCGEEMEVVKKDESVNPDNDKKYDRSVYVCKKDDVWVRVESPRN